MRSESFQFARMNLSAAEASYLLDPRDGWRDALRLTIVEMVVRDVMSVAFVPVESASGTGVVARLVPGRAYSTTERGPLGHAAQIIDQTLHEHGGQYPLSHLRKIDRKEFFNAAVGEELLAARLVERDGIVGRLDGIPWKPTLEGHTTTEHIIDELAAAESSLEHWLQAPATNASAIASLLDGLGTLPLLLPDWHDALRAVATAVELPALTLRTIELDVTDAIDASLPPFRRETWGHAFVGVLFSPDPLADIGGHF